MYKQTHEFLQASPSLREGHLSKQVKADWLIGKSLRVRHS